MATSIGSFRNEQPRLSGPPTVAGVYFARKALLEKYLTSLTFSDDPRLSDLVGAMHYSLLSGDKRLRPVLCMEVANTFGLDPAEVLPSAAAIEFIHTFSLIHADLPALREDGYRLGTPACHEKFGEDIAILAGDGFFGESLNLITVYQRGTPEQLSEVVRELARSAGVSGIVGGMVLKKSCAGRAPEHERVKAMHDYGTGVPIEASARIGAILADATAEEREAISEYARQFGLCFQTTDEVLSTTLATGGPDKNPGGDAERGKAAFVRVYGLSGTRRLAEESYEGALEALKQIDRDTAGLAELARFVRYGNP